MSVPLTCIAFFGSEGGKGWAEKHALSVDDTPGDLLPFLQAFKTIIDNKRRPLLGSDCYVKGLRVSYPTVGGDIASSGYRYTPFAFPSTKRTGAAPTLSAKVRFGEASNTQFSDTNLRGFWDDVERDEQLNFTTDVGVAWKSLLDEYTAALVAGGYGWEGMNGALTQRGDITGYVLGVDGMVTFTIVVTSGPPLTSAPGTKLQFRAARLNDSNSVLNETHIVTVVDATHVRTVKRTAALPFLSAGTFVMERKQFLRYTGVQYTILAKRAMGRPTLQSASRKRARARG